MKLHRTGSPVSIVLALVLSITACSSGSGGGPPATNDSATPPPPTPTSDGPQVIITSPDAEEVDTTDDAMDIAGSASSDSGIGSVTWKTDRGESGDASGTESWSVERVPLAIGANTITVTATDGAGSTHSDSIVINRESEGTGSATLSWEAPTERTDGTALTDLAGFRIHYGRMSGVYDYEIDLNTSGVLTYVIEDLVPGEWYFAVTAYDAEGLESDFSNEVRRVIP